MNALKTKKLILHVYNILLIVGGGLSLIPIKKGASKFELHEEQNMYMSVYVFLILNSIFLFYNIITFYSRKYPHLPDIKLGYEAFVGHIFSLFIYVIMSPILQEVIIFLTITFFILLSI